MNYLKIEPTNCADFKGWSTSIWFAGCTHMCQGCYNKIAWKSSSGEKFTEDVKQYLFECVSKPYIDNLVLLGGDPLFYKWLPEMRVLLEDFKQELPNKNIVLFTGYTWEQIIDSQELLSVAELCDIVVDGKFEKDLKITGEFRGSSNQRYIDVKESLRQNKVAIKEI